MFIKGKFRGMPVQTQPILTAVQVNVCEVLPCICSALFNETCLAAYHTGFLAVCLLNSQLQEQLWAELAQNKSCLLLIIPNREIYWRTWWRGRRIQVHNHHGCMLGFRDRDGLNKHAFVKEDQAEKPGWPCTARQALHSQTASETDISMQLPEVSSP